MSKSLGIALSLVLLTACLVLVNSLGSVLLSPFAIDLTSERLYSLSQGSKQLIAKIQQPIELRVFFTRKAKASNPGLRLYARRLDKLLAEIEREAEGMINVVYVDPSDSPEDLRWAEKFEMRPYISPDGSSLYFGLVGISSAGSEQKIPYFDLRRAEFLEYDIMSLIHSLQLNRRPKLAVVPGIRLVNEARIFERNNPNARDVEWLSSAWLRTKGDVDYLNPTREGIPPETDVLLLIHPRSLPEGFIYEVDQFVLKGGKLLILTDPLCMSDVPTKEMAAEAQSRTEFFTFPRSSEINRLLIKWGVKQKIGGAVADPVLASPARHYREEDPAYFLLWLSMTEQQLSQRDPITASLESLFFPWAGAFSVRPVEGVLLEPLVTSSEESAMMPNSTYRVAGGKPKALADLHKPSGVREIIALKLSGEFESNFPDGPPFDPAYRISKATAESHVFSSMAKGAVVVVGDVDFISDQFTVVRSERYGNVTTGLLNDNLLFFQNIIDDLLGNPELIAVRSRGTLSRPFERVLELQRRAAEHYRKQESQLLGQQKALTERLRATVGSSGAFSKAAPEIGRKQLQEIRKLQQQKAKVAEQLRVVRQKMVEDKDKLGSVLFVINTFAVPVLLLLVVLLAYFLLDKGQRSS